MSRRIWNSACFALAAVLAGMIPRPSHGPAIGTLGQFGIPEEVPA